MSISLIFRQSKIHISNILNDIRVSICPSVL